MLYLYNCGLQFFTAARFVNCVYFYFYFLLLVCVVLDLSIGTNGTRWARVDGVGVGFLNNSIYGLIELQAARAPGE